MIVRVHMPADTTDTKIAQIETIQAGFDSRLSHIESSVEKLVGTVNQIASAVTSLQQTRGTVPWASLATTGISVVGAIVVAILFLNKPLEQRVDANRTEFTSNEATLKSRMEAAEAYATSSRTLIGDIRLVNQSQEKDLTDLRREFDEVREKGSPVTDKRLTLLEYRINQLEARK